MQAPPEKLGSFYLGATYDLDAGAATEEPLNYDARDLITHAVVVGMTGSGKTGMCVGLLEEAAIDRVPAIIIDPKGDLGNLLLQFPDGRPEDFRPWINEDDATRKGMTPDDYAAAEAEKWTKGLAGWGIGLERLRTLRDTVDYTIFTPGSDAGVPINIMGSLAAPGLDWDLEAEAIRERINGTVAALMGLANVNADPVRSREAVLLASIFEHYWRKEQDMDLAILVKSIATPPMDTIGVFEVNTFYPEKDRFALAMAFNNLIAAPSFQSWLMGEPLDVASLYYTPEGKPRHSIFYIAHLSDSERMFFVTLLLENILTWMRKQSGTTSLRALLYFDEVFGYFPPTAEPPSKRPLLTLMKQARAFGVGVVLVTQNPVDLDYKGLTNAGTWVIGKLQAERDKARVMEGLKGAIAEAGSNSAVNFDELITRLSSRVFLMHNVNASGPVVFNTRWAQSYLRGPLTRPQVRTLMADKRPARSAPPPVASVAAGAGSTGKAGEERPAATSAAAAPAPVASAEAPDGYLSVRPKVPSIVSQVFVPLQVDEELLPSILGRQVGVPVSEVRTQLGYRPAVLARVKVDIEDRTLGIQASQDRSWLVALPESGTVDVEVAEPFSIAFNQLHTEPLETPPDKGPYFAKLPATAATSTELRAIRSRIADHVFNSTRAKVRLQADLGIAQRPDEPNSEYFARVATAARERRDAEIDKLQTALQKKIDAIAQKIRKEQIELAGDEAKASALANERWVTVGEKLLKSFLGRRSSGSVTQLMTKQRQVTAAQAAVQESKIELEHLTREYERLTAELETAVAEITSRYEAMQTEFTTKEIAPRKSDVNVQEYVLAWVPEWLVQFEANGRRQESRLRADVMPG